ncbi:MAG: hypothetical protein QXI19_02145 [Candidatus Caldarchaeum sp.]
MKLSAILVALGAQSCQVEDPNAILYPTDAPVWFSGWLDEGKYIYWTFYAYSEVHVTAEFSGYRFLNDLHVTMLLIYAEDFERWKSGKPVRTVGWVDTETVTGPRFGIWLYVNPAYYAVILNNRWVPDFSSGDTYVVVRGAVR